jgi:hypothetical protein
MADDRQLFRDAQSGKPGITTTAPRTKQVGVRFPDGRVIVPPVGVDAETFARWNGIALEPRSRDKQPPPGVPHKDELNMSDRDSSADSSYDEIVYESGAGSPPSSAGTAVIPEASALAATSGLGFEKSVSDEYTPLRSVSREHGNAFVDQLAVHTISGKAFVKTAELEALVSKTNSRGGKGKRADDDGAEAKVTTEIANARAARKRAFAMRKSQQS